MSNHSCSVSKCDFNANRVNGLNDAPPRRRLIRHYFVGRDGIFVLCCRRCLEAQAKRSFIERAALESDAATVGVHRHLVEFGATRFILSNNRVAVVVDDDQ
jgi:hypothetical protein